MAITFVANASWVGANWDNSPNPTVSVPAGTVDDDLMIAGCIRNADSDAIASESGFTEIHQLTQGGRFAWFYKIASSEGATVEFSTVGTTTRNGGIHVVSFTGVDTSTPFDVTFSSGDHIATDGFDAPPVELTCKPITTATNNAFVVLMAGNQSNNPDVIVPSGYSDGGYSDGGTGKNMCCAYKDITSAGLETPGAYQLADLSGNSYGLAGITLAIKPAGAASTNPKGPLGLPLKGPFGGPL